MIRRYEMNVVYPDTPDVLHLASSLLIDAIDQLLGLCRCEANISGRLEVFHAVERSVLPAQRL